MSLQQLACHLLTCDGTMQADEDFQQAEEIVREDSSKLLLEGGQQRTVFHLSIEMQRLEAVLNYETGDAPPLGSISVQVSAYFMNFLLCASHALFYFMTNRTQNALADGGLCCPGHWF